MVNSRLCKVKNSLNYFLHFYKTIKGKTNTRVSINS